MIDNIKPLPIYTAFDYDASVLCSDCNDDGCMTAPNAPRRSLDGTRAIATGIFNDVPNPEYLTQEEAETLMQSPQWTRPEQETNNDAV